jgi:uncharacterized repeat protein (TIGR01451 family)
MFSIHRWTRLICALIAFLHEKNAGFHEMVARKCSRMNLESRRFTPTGALFARLARVALVLSPLILFQSGVSAATQDGALRMEVITAYNFVVDSNIESPAGKSPSAAHLGVKIYNDGPTTLNNVVVNIGELITPATSTGNPGVFASRTVDVTGQYSGTFALEMPGGATDAVRVIPSIAPGEYVAQYFFVTYPLKDSLGRSVTGSAPVVSDDLWLNYDIWAYADDGVATRRVDQTTKVTMRNEISAMANKIWPNGDNKVPDEYLDIIESVLGWRPSVDEPRIPGAKISEGIWYDLGNVGAGFDNNGDGIPDRNAWLQPVGDPSQFSPLAARMVKAYGIVIVKLNDGTEQLIPFEDRLYFENMPANNTGAVGLVYYEFLPLNASYPSNLTPYQEVASGYDNEKFNADYGTVTGKITTENPTADIEKTGPSTLQKSQVADYTIVATNTGEVQFGWPDQGVPVVIEDIIPTGLEYVSGSAVTVANVTNPAGGIFMVYYSTDNGATWTTTEPVPASSVNRLRWVLTDRPLQPGDTATVVFSATVPSNFVGSSFTNTAILKLGTESEIDRDDWPTTIIGNNSVGDFVWRDLDRDGVQDGGAETGIANIGVSLYLDSDNDGILDAGEPLYATTSTNASGAYLFSSVPDGRYIAVVNSTDTDLPYGYTLKAGVSDRYAIDLDSAGTNPSAVNFLTADWPFIAGLEVTKSVSPTVYNGGDLITYDIHLDNHMQTLTLPVPNEYTIYANATAFDKSNAAAKATENQASGAPNSVFTFIDWNANSDRLVSTGVTPSFTLPGGSSITKVELIVRGYQSTPLSNDQLDIQIGHSDRTIALFQTRTTAQMNALVGVSQDLVIDITTAAGTVPGWTAAEINSLSAALVANKTGGGDTGDYNVDSIGFRVTTNNTPFTGTSGPNTIAIWPLVDTFDPAKLQFVSASVSPDVVGSGTLEWYNLGPVNAGARKTITVTFRAQSPTDTTIPPDGLRDPMIATNTVSTQGSSIGIVPLFQSGLPAGHDDGSVNVTINPAGRIGDFVYWDVNGNGSFGTGDIPLAGVIVQLFQGGVYTGRSAVTDANGYYEFSGLADGTYQVRISTDPANDVFSLPFTTGLSSLERPAGGGVSGTVGGANSYVFGASVVINNSDTDPNNDTNFLQDFGFDSNTASLISGKLFRDWDGDGFQDPGDEPLVGFTVTLTGANSRTTTTDANGNYFFTNLTSAGSSTVTVTAPPANHVQTEDPDGDFNNATTITVVLGNAYLNNDFGYRPSGLLTIGDTLYYDWNGNGTQDAGEGGIANVTIRLYEDQNGDGVINSTDALIGDATTNASGFYQFSGLIEGNYIVSVDTSDPDFSPSYLQTQDYDGLFDDSAKVNLTDSLNTVDFGYQPLGTSSIGNLVWLDVDNDGIKDPDESGINGVTVQLFRSDQTPGVSTPYATTTTSGGGLYSFTNLPVGSYTIYIPASNFGTGQPLASYQLSSSTTVNLDNQTDNDDNGIQTSAGAATSSPLIALSAAESDQTIDFGFTGAASIGDIVFYDLNGNGNLDFTETGINDVVMELYLDVDQDGIEDGGFIATTTTATVGGVAGFYEFTGLAPNTYIVKVRTSTLPAGVVQTADPDLDGIPVNNNDLDPENDGDHRDERIILFSGSNYTGADFGYQPPGAIGDFVWLDLNQDGIQDPGEPGIANVEIQISGASTYSVFTDPDGYWSTFVPDGNWTVTVLSSNFNASAPLENRVQTYDADGTGTANTTSLVVAGGVVTTPSALPQGNLGIDFGYSIDGDYGIAGTVLINDTRTLGTADDIDNFADDGVDMDAGPLDETELEGILVYLYSGSTFLGTSTTDSNGNYSFSGLPDGTYNVIIGTTAPPLNTATLTTTASNNAAVSVVQDTGTSVIQTVTISGAFVNDVDFAFISEVDFDFGDLPLVYSMTTLSQDGARHTIPEGGSTRWLGTNPPDSESNGIYNAQAAGDDLVGTDDEDGVTPVSIASWVDGTNGGSINVVVNGSGWLVGWIDWNNDGDFLEPGEFVANQAVTTGTISVSFNIPAGTITGDSQSWLSRFRLMPSQPPFPVFSYEGEATDGEVEDHLFQKNVGGSIGDYVWIDSNGDGVVNGTEVGLGGITVELRDNLNALLDTQVTSNGAQDVDGDGLIDPVGYYRFRNLSAATYNIIIPSPPVGYTTSYDEDDGTSSPDAATQVVLSTDEQHLTADFGFEPLLASIAGQVRYDLDADGNLLDPDPGAPSITIQLWTDPNGDGDPSDGVQVGETSTDPSGFYIFTDVPTGNYVVVEINLPGTTSTADIDGGNFDRITVAMVGTPIIGRDFLDTAPDGYLGAIGDFVFIDANANGLQDLGETGFDDVTVNLYRPGFGPDGIASNADDNDVVATTTTSGGGAYSFGNLVPSTYFVEFVTPSGYIFSPQNVDSAGVDGPINSDPSPLTGRTDSFGLVSGETKNTIDAGFVLMDPSITLVKSGALNLDLVAPTGVANPGDVINYTFTVTNTGNVTLTNVTVTDPLVTVSGEPITLLPGQSDSTTFTAAYTLTQSDINAGTFTNTATTTGTPPVGDPVTDEDDDTQPLPSNPSITLVKSGALNLDLVAPTGVANPGDVINYTFTVTNTGNVTLTNVTVTDPLVTVSGEPITLLPGQSDSTTFTAAYTLTQSDINAGTFTNTATTTGTPPVGDPVTDEDDDTQPLPSNPSITLVKSGALNLDLVAPTGVANPGDVINYTFTVTNTGNVTLTNVTVTDPLVTVSGEPITLLPGQSDSTTFTAAYTLTQSDINAGTFTNTATTTGTPPVGDPVTDEDDDTQPLPSNPSITLVKSGALNLDLVAPTGVANPGDVINYTFTVTNTGNVTLTNVTVTDPLVTVSGEPITLLPGQSDSTTFTAAYTLTQSDINAGTFTNTATTTGTPPVGDPVTDEDDDTQPLPSNPSITLVKSGALNLDLVAPTGVANPGDVINYTFTVTNTGNVTLTNVTVTDPLVTVSGEPITLLPGQSDSTTFTAAYTLTQSDINAGTFTNTATTTGTPPVGDPVTDEDDDTQPLPSNPSITLVKSGALNLDLVAPTGVANPGDVINYTFTVTNTGNVTLTNVTVTDPLVTVSGEPITLLPGQSDSTTFTAAYTLTQSDINAGTFTNTATTTGTPPVGDPVTDEDDDTQPLPSNPSITLVKSGALNLDLVAPTGVANPGDVINYTFTVTNTGNVTLTNVTVTDPLVTVSGEPITLLPGQSDSTTFTAAYTLTQSDINAGTFTNTATTTGTPPVGDPVTDEDDDTQPLPSNPSITLVKSGALNLDLVAPTGVANPGDVINYTFTVTNTGNVTLTNVT